MIDHNHDHDREQFVDLWVVMADDRAVSLSDLNLNDLVSLHLRIQSELANDADAITSSD